MMYIYIQNRFTTRISLKVAEVQELAITLNRVNSQSPFEEGDKKILKEIDELALQYIKTSILSYQSTHESALPTKRCRICEIY